MQADNSETSAHSESTTEKAVTEIAQVEDCGTQRTGALADDGGHAATATATFRCRKCRRELFTDANLLPHSSAGAAKEKTNARKWGSVASRQAVTGGDAGTLCTSLFFEAMPWMDSLDGQSGRLMCPCGAKLGSFSWHGLECSCGGWQSPAFQVHEGRLDRITSQGALPRNTRVVAPTMSL